jgi:hypothetical protein
MTTPLERLNSHFQNYRDPIAEMDWRAADPSLPWLPPELLSLAGLKEQSAMSRDQLVQFSRIEFARLCATGLWLEGLLINRVTSRDFPASRIEEARIMLQEVRDECGHGLMFLEMISRAGLSDIPLLGSKRLLSRIAHHLSPASPEFWALVFIGESVTDSFAIKALKLSSTPGNEVCPLARQVLARHHRDEARHIAAARILLEARIDAMSAARKRLFHLAMKHLLPQFLSATLYPTVASLTALGLPAPKRTVRAALTSPGRRQVVEACAAPALDVLARHGLSPIRREHLERQKNSSEAAR